MQDFMQRNRDWRNSPQLVFTHDRLDREVSMRQAVYTTLVQSYEAARIDEVRNTPVITVMEPPDVPAKPDPRLALLKSLLAGIVGLALGAFFAAVRQAFSGVLSLGRPHVPRPIRDRRVRARRSWRRRPGPRRSVSPGHGVVPSGRGASPRGTHRPDEPRVDLRRRRRLEHAEHPVES